MWLGGIDGNVFNIISLADQEEAKEAWSWHPFDPWENSDPKLKDHYFYLVKTKDRATPMKAMYHIDKPFGFAPVDGNFDPEEVTAWIELPEVVNGK